MENKQNGTTKGGSVYITVDKFFNPVHISMKGTGEEGYQEFMQEDVEKALKSGEMPDMGLMYYNVPDMAGKGNGRAWNHIAEIPTSVGSGVLPVK